VLTYIDINEIIRDIKEKHKLYTKEETEQIIEASINNGFNYKGFLIKITKESFFNPFLNKEAYWYHFVCPECERKAKKLYIENGNIKCRKCAKIRARIPANSSADRVLQIQKYLSQIYDTEHKITPKRKNVLIKHIVSHYEALDKEYRISQNTAVFKELQNWCLGMLVDNDKPKEYKAAVKDVLKILKDSKNILLKTRLIKTQ